MTMPTAPGGILETLTVVVSLDVQQPRKRLCLSKSRFEVYWSLFLLRVHKFIRPEYRRNNLSGDDNDGGLLFELDGDDTGFDGIFEEQ
jgi:hypothetical protein